MFFLHHAPELLSIILNASSVTARVLSLTVLLLSLAPLGSIYVLFFSIGLGTGTGPNYYESNDDSLTAVLKSPNATLEELWTALFNAQSNPNLPARAVLEALKNQNDYYLLPVTAKSMQHLRFLMPWILSLMLGIFVPCLLSTVTLLRRRRRLQRQQNIREWSPAREKKILKQLTRSLEPYTKILSASDRVVVDDVGGDNTSWAAPQETLDEASLQQQWIIPAPAMTVVENNNCATNSRVVSGLCGICLDLFAVEQAVAWSSNPACVHCFHGACIQTWFLRTYLNKNISKHQCPCCRQSFLVATTKRGVPS